MKINKYLILGLMSLTLLSTSCEDNFLDINTNPNASTDVPPGTLMANALLAISQVRLNTTSPDGAAYIQHHKPVVVLTAPDTYRYSSIGNNNFYRFTFFGDIIKDLNLAAAGAASRGEMNAVAQLRILQAWAWVQGADRWGEIPFTEANDPNFQNPQFDEPAVIYQGVIDILDNALAMIDPASSGEPNTITNFDLVYGGDVDKWERFANSMKLRVLMRLSYVENRASDISALLSSGKFIEELDGSQDALFRYEPTRNNQNFDYATFDNFTQFGSFQVDDDGNRVHQRWRHSSKAMVEYMTATDDPRMFSFFQRDIRNESGPITGSTNGAAALPPTAERGYVSLFYIRQDAPDEWFRASEYWLLAAEAYQRGLASGDAQAAFENGLRASMNLFDGSTYAIDQADKDNFVSALTLASATDAEALIQEQQWVALFGNGTEAWANWRRTKQPELTPANGGPITTVISRIPLPESAFFNPNAPEVPPVEDDPVYFERN